MLLRTLFALVFLSAIAETMIHGVHALAQELFRRHAVIAARAEAIAAAQAAQQAIADALSNGGDPRSLAPAAPSPAPTCVLASKEGCAMLGEATVAFEVPAPAATACANQTCATYVQGNDAVDEGRIDATIQARVVTADGAILATRDARVTFRTLLVAPYAAFAGASDASLAAPAFGTPGSDAGILPDGTAPGTLVDVLYENRATGKSTPANVWVPQANAAVAGAPSWSP